MRKPTQAQIEKQKVHRAVEARGEITPIPDPPKKVPTQHKETDEERRERWNDMWGENTDDADCKRLDRIHGMISEEYRGVDSSRIELNLITLAKMYLLRDKAIENGDDAAIKRYTDSIDKVMQSEGMRANDQKPVEALRPDALIDRLEKKGVKLMSQEEVAKYINGDKGKFNTSIDVVDYILNAWNNTVRKNSGESEIGYLPKSLQIEDKFGELQPRLTQKEADTLAELGEIIPPREK